MKKIIVASICSLAVSLFGMLGTGQIPSNDNASLENEQNVTTEQENNAEVISQDTLSESSDKDLVNNVITEEVTEEVTEEATKAATEEVTKAATKEVTKEVTEEVKKEETEKATEEVKKEVTEKATEEVVAEVATDNETQVVETSDTKTVNSPVASNTQNISYKNVDLSDCNTASEVINQLNSKGYTIVNASNAQSFKSVEDILSYIQKIDSKNCTINNINNNATTGNITTTDTTAGTSTGSTPTTNNTTTGTTTPATNATSNSDISSYANQVLQLVNQERAKEGLSALSMTAELNNAANIRAQETVQSFSHTRPNGTSFFTVLQENNISYRACGENIAYGQKTPEEVVTGWMNSSGHRANIMNVNFGKIGIGVYKASNGLIYWSQLFTN